MLKYTLGPEHRDYSIGSGFYMKIDDDLRKCVVFIGYEDNKADLGGIWCIGTGFLFYYKGVGYLATAKHVANELGDNPFMIRVNGKNGTTCNIPNDQAEWLYHPDNSVDIAVAECSLTIRLYDALYLVLESEVCNVGEKNIGIGDICYTIGLFRLMSGKMKNLPVVHTGNIALVPGEKIPVKDWDDPDINTKKRKYVEGYLIESQSLDGLSGSPVFARPTLDFPCGRDDEKGICGSILPLKNLFLIGIWQGAWNAPPDEVLAAEIEKGKRVRVSMGMGIVVPSTKLLELLEEPELQNRRTVIHAEREANIYAVEPESVTNPSNRENPQHKEDFNSLVSAAAKKKKPDDET